MRKQFMITTDWITTTAGAADDAALGAWVRLHAYCAPRLNGGRMVGAKAWTKDTAVRVCGVTRRAIDSVVAAGIAEWDGEDLVLRGYDGAGEQLWQRKSHGGKTGREKQLAGTGGITPTGSPQRESPRGELRGVPEPVPRGDSEGEGENESTTVTAAQRQQLAAVAAEGGYLTFKSEDIRLQWLADLDTDTPDEIRVVMRWGRQKTGKPVRLPSLYCGHRADMAKAARAAVEAQRSQAEQQQRRQAEREQVNERTKAASVAAAKDRALVAALLSLADEATDLSEAQAEIIGRLRTTYDAGKPVGLILVSGLERLPVALIEQAKARTSEHMEEGTTA